MEIQKNGQCVRRRSERLLAMTSLETFKSKKVKDDSKTTGFGPDGWLLLPKKVHDVRLIETTKGRTGTFFLVEWYETVIREYISSALAYEICPDLVMAYYETQAVSHPPPQNGNEDLDDDDDVQSLE